MSDDLVLKKLVEYAKNISYEKLPDKVTHEAKRRLLDTLGCAIAAFDASPCVAAKKFASSFYKTDKGSTILGSNIKTTPDVAAFVNGTMMRYLDFNDTYLSKEPAHPSDNISAVLAVAEAESCSGRDIIRAIVLGYEIQCRLCDAASIRMHGWDHVTYGPISTSVLSSSLLGLSDLETANAISIATTANIALRQTRAGEISNWKASAFANAARNGVFAAYLAKSGMEGPKDIFKGIYGFETLVSGKLNLGNFGGEGRAGFKIMDSSIKYYPAEYHSQTAINLAIKLKNMVDVDNIESVDVFTFKTAVQIIGSGKERWNPKSRETADHSLPYIIAASMLDGTIEIDSFNPDRFERANPLMQKIKIIEDESHNALYPEGNPTGICVTLKDGSKVEEESIYPIGHAGNPMTDEQVVEKFKNNCSFSTGKKNEIIEIVMNIENEGIEKLTKAMNIQ